MSLIGYARVSKGDQRPEVQEAALKAAGCERIYVDHGASGKLASRPEWDKALEQLREGDVLVAVKVDRIGRSLQNVLDIANLLKERGVKLKMLDQPELDTTSRNGKLIFSILGALAEWEAAIISERTKEGLEEAKRRHGGKIPGRKPSMSPAKIRTAQELYDKGQLSASQIAEIVGVSRATLHRHIKHRETS